MKAELVLKSARMARKLSTEQYLHSNFEEYLQGNIKRLYLLHLRAPLQRQALIFCSWSWGGGSDLDNGNGGLGDGGSRERIVGCETRGELRTRDRNSRHASTASSA